MNSSKGLILKGTATAAIVATTTTGAVYNEEITNFFSGGSSTENVGKIIEGKTGKDSLGLPDDWEWPTEINETKTKELKVEQLKRINFDGRGEGDLNIRGDISSPLFLTMEKVKNVGKLPEVYKFIFKTNSEGGITVGKGDNRTLFTLRRGMDLEFKIKKIDKKWFLKRAWTAGELGEKVGLICPASGTKNECSFRETIKVYEGADKRAIKAQVVISSSRMLFSTDEKDHYQGFKFIPKGGDIFLLPDENDDQEITSLEKTNTSYEIKHYRGDWYLSKKTIGA